MIDLGSFDKTSPGFSGADAINGHGSVTGWAENVDLSGGAAHAFVWTPSAANATTGKMVDLGTLAINPDAAYSQSQGLAINSSGVVVGFSNPAGSTGLIDATIWQPGAGGTYTLNDLNNLIPSGTGFTLTRADAINDAGLIVVEGMLGGTRHALLLTPQTNSAALAAPAALATTATAPGPIRSPAALSTPSIRISAVAPGGPGLGGQSAPASAANRVAAQPAPLPIFDFALADLVARPRPRPPSMAGPRARRGRIPGRLFDRSFPRCKPFQRRYRTLPSQDLKELKMMHLSNRSCTVNPRGYQTPTFSRFTCARFARLPTDFRLEPATSRKHSETVWRRSVEDRMRSANRLNCTAGGAGRRKAFALPRASPTISIVQRRTDNH